MVILNAQKEDFDECKQYLEKLKRGEKSLRNMFSTEYYVFIEQYYKIKKNIYDKGIHANYVICLRGGVWSKKSRF